MSTQFEVTREMIEHFEREFRAVAKRNDLTLEQLTIMLYCVYVKLEDDLGLDVENALARGQQ